MIRGESYNFTGSVACDVEDTGNGFIARFPSDSSVKPGDRIAQAMVVPVGRVQFTEVDELGTTARGTGGFGSTGK